MSFKASIAMASIKRLAGKAPPSVRKKKPANKTGPSAHRRHAIGPSSSLKKHGTCRTLATAVSTMSTTFDKREEHFVALVAKAGCSLAQVSSHHHAAPKASTTAKDSPIISDGDEPDENSNGDDTSSSASTSTCHG